MNLYYEDIVLNLDENLLKILDFIEEDPSYIAEYLETKETNLLDIQNHYKKRHSNSCRSSENGVNLVYYSKGKDPELLIAIDKRLREINSYIYDKYLKRFEYSEEMYAEL